MKTNSALRLLCLTSAVAALASCGNIKRPFDWDFRRGGGLDTSEAAIAASADRPAADARGVISYPGYQVALARRGDTVASVAARVGLDANELATYNALKTDNVLRDGEVLALPKRVAEGASGSIIGGTVQTQPLDVSSIASGAIDRAAPQPSNSNSGAVIGTTIGSNAKPVAPAPAAKSNGAEPAQHRVKPGETAFTIARAYNVSARALADWNGLDADMSVREGQYLMIPPAAGGTKPVAASVVSQPGAGSATPVPPSAKEPLPLQDEPPKATATAAAPAVKETPPSPDLSAERSAASSTKFSMPVAGQIIRGYSKGKNDGIDIAAGVGTAIKAAGDGTVAAITKDVDQVPILVIRHADNLLTVYAGIDAVGVAKGASVKRGQTIAKVRSATPSFLHFEVRKGFDSVDPMPYLQ